MLKIFQWFCIALGKSPNLLTWLSRSFVIHSLITFHPHLSFVILVPWAKFLLKYFSCKFQMKEKQLNVCTWAEVLEREQHPLAVSMVLVGRWGWEVNLKTSECVRGPLAHLQVEILPSLLPAFWRMQNWCSQGRWCICYCLQLQFF